jgi:hypothetical protein
MGAIVVVEHPVIQAVSIRPEMELCLPFGNGPRVQRMRGSGQSMREIMTYGVTW